MGPKAPCSLCCYPIMHVDDEIIDMQLEEIWEGHRRRGKSRARGAERGRQNLKFLGGNAQSGRNRQSGRGKNLTRSASGDKKKQPK
mmetsp:Transcript_12515/g.15418  ORF Transcript_12515/g.15418 Transcript_12515/m.15418 type:complete len:86 (+) Transcript_12515:186-443(+)